MSDPQLVGEDFVYQTLVVGHLQTNCTIVGSRKSKQAIVVDPGDEADTVLLAANKLGLKIVGIYSTHGHLDHILAAGDLQQACPGSKLHINKNDQFWWDNFDKQKKMMGIRSEASLPPPDVWLDGNERVEQVTGLTGQCLFTPGHTRGSTCFYFEQLKLVLTGDTLFRGNVGRTDLIDGDFDQLATSIRTRLYTLSDDVKVIPGHGPFSTIGFEKKFNVFVPAAEEDSNASNDHLHPYFTRGVCCCPNHTSHL